MEEFVDMKTDKNVVDETKVEATQKQQEGDSISVPFPPPRPSPLSEEVPENTSKETIVKKLTVRL